MVSKSQLLEYIRINKVDDIQHSVDATAHNKYNNALTLACENGHTDVLENLLKINTTAYVNKSRLIRAACFHGQLDTFKYLTKDITNKNLKNIIDTATIISTIRNDNFEMILHLEENNIKIPNHETYLNIICETKNVAFAKHYLSDITVPGSIFAMALIKTIVDNNILMFKYLYSLYGDCVIGAKDGLKIACENGFIEIVKHIVNIGLSFRSKWYYESYFNFSCMSNQINVVKYFMEEIDILPNQNNDNYFEQLLTKKCYDVISYLVSKNYSVKFNENFLKHLLFTAKYSVLLELLKHTNNQNYGYYKNISIKINDRLLINSLFKNRAYIDVLFIYKN